MTAHPGREFRLASRPDGEPTLDNFDLVEVEVPDPGPGQVLVRNLFISVDPYMRPRMNDVPSYVPPFQVGKALDGGAVGEVIASGSDDINGRRSGRSRPGLARPGPGPVQIRARGGSGHRPVAIPRRPGDARPDRLCRPARRGRIPARRHGVRLRRRGRGRRRGRADRETSGRDSGDRQRRLAGEGGLPDRPAWFRRRVQLSRGSGPTGAEGGRAGGHRRLLRQRRRGAPRGRDQLAEGRRPGRAVRHDRQLQRHRRDRPGEPVAGDRQAPDACVGSSSPIIRAGSRRCAKRPVPGCGTAVWSATRPLWMVWRTLPRRSSACSGAGTPARWWSGSSPAGVARPEPARRPG